MYDTPYTDDLLSHITVQWLKAQVFMKDFSNFQNYILRYHGTGQF